MNRRTFVALTGISLFSLFILFIAFITANPSDSSPIPTRMVLPTISDSLTSESEISEVAQIATDTPPVVAVSPTNTPTVQITPIPTSEPIQLEIPSQPVTEQVVIRFDANTSDQQRLDYIESLNGTVSQQIDALNTVVVNVPASVEQSLPASPIVLSSEPDYYVAALMDVTVPTSDVYYANQWALPAIGVPDAWLEMPSDAPSVVVAVIDSGVCLNHPDLQGRIGSGWDYVEDDAVPQDDFGHGCGVAGIIAANIDNGIGIAGVAPNAQIMPLRVLDSSGMGTYSDVAAAIVYAADNGAQIINLSLGGSNASTILQDAIDYAIAKDVMIIAAAGNTGGSVLYPAAYEPVIAVGSVDANLELSSFSSRGPEIDVLAPGRDILTTTNDNSYKAVSGTSFAAPYVSGVAVGYLSLDKNLILDGNLIRIDADELPSNIIINTPVYSQTPTSVISTFTIYKDNDYGWSVQYPISLKVENEIISNELMPEIVIRKRTLFTTTSGEQITIDIWDNFSGVDLVDWFNNNYAQFLSDQATIQIATEPNGKIAGAEAILVSDLDIESGNIAKQAVIFSMGNQIFRIEYFLLNYGENAADFRDILKNFSFLTRSTGITILNNLPYISEPLIESVSPLETNCLGFVSPGNPYNCYGGNCTWWARYKRPEFGDVSWGNANEWYDRAIQENYDTGNLPMEGAVAVWGGVPNSIWGNEGHVAYVESFDENQEDFSVSEMNYPAGGLNYRVWSTNPQSKNYRPNFLGFIYNKLQADTLQNDDFIILYENSNFDASGKYVVIRPGENVQTFTLPDWMDNKISSIWVGKNVCAYAYALPTDDLSFNGDYSDSNLMNVSIFHWIGRYTYEERPDDYFSDLGIFHWRETQINVDNGVPFNTGIVMDNDISSIVAGPLCKGASASGISAQGNCLYGPDNNDDNSEDPPPTETPPPAPPIGGGDYVVTNISYPSNVSPGQQFTPEVTVCVNNGWLSESRGDMLRNTDGNLYGAYEHVQFVGTVSSGECQTLVFYQPMVAPNSDGTYTSHWQVSIGGDYIAGTEVLIQFTVGNSSSDEKVVTLHDDPGFNGERFSYGVGRHDISNIWDNRAHSVTIPSGMSVRLYENGGFDENNGQNMCFNISTSSLPGPYAEGVSSFIVYDNNSCQEEVVGDPLESCGGVILYDSGGNRLSLTSSIGNLAELGWNDKARMLEVLGPYEVTAYDGYDFDGWSHGPFGAGSLVSIGTNVTSVKITKIGSCPTGGEEYPPECSIANPGVFLVDDGGNKLRLTSSVGNLAEISWNDRGRTMYVVGPYRGTAYDDYNLQGWSHGPLVNGDSQGIGTNVSSVRVEYAVDCSTPLPKPDLIPSAISGLTNPVSLSLSTGNHNQDTLIAGQPLYVDWVYRNDHNANADAHYSTLWIDGEKVIENYSSGLNANTSSEINDWEITWDTPGCFPIRFDVDTYNDITEDDEGNNTWYGQACWSPQSIENTRVFTTDDLGPASLSDNDNTVSIPEVQSEAYKTDFAIGDTIRLYLELESSFTSSHAADLRWVVIDPVGREVPALEHVETRIYDSGGWWTWITRTISADMLTGDYKLIGLVTSDGLVTTQSATFYVDGLDTVEVVDLFTAPVVGSTALQSNEPITALNLDTVTASESDSSYTAGDTILLYIDVFNNVINGEQAYFEWQVIDPWGRVMPTMGWAGDLGVGLGRQWWMFNPTIPTNAVTGDYTFIGSTTHNGRTITRSMTFYVSGGSIPANDDIDSAPLIDNFVYIDVVNTWSATTASDDPIPGCASGTQESNSVWYRVVLPVDGTLLLDTEGSDYDTVLAVWSGSRGNLSQLGCDDDGGTDRLSSLQLPVNEGTNYYIQVMDYGRPNGGLLHLRANFRFTGISGTIYIDDGTTPITENAWVNVWNANTQEWVNGASVKNDGTYLLDLPSGEYFISAEAYDHVTEYYDNAGEYPENSTLVTVVDGQSISGINFSLDPAGSISGVVTDHVGIPLANVGVVVEDTNVGACTDENGFYHLYGVSLNTPHIIYADGNSWCNDESNFYLREYWQETYFENEATAITLHTLGEEVSNIDFTLIPGGSISGSIVESDTSNIITENAWVNIFDADTGDWVVTTYVQPNGTYYISVPEDEYVLRVVANDHVNKYYDNGQTWEDATPIVVVAGKDTSINFSLDPAGSVSGIVTDENGTPLANVGVTVEGTNIGACSDENGVYYLYQIPLNTPYIIHASGNSWCDNAPYLYLGEYWQDVPSESDATPITVFAKGEEVSNINFSLARGGTISGYIFEVNGVIPITENAWVTVIYQTGDIVSSTEVNSNGSYRVTVPPGDYLLYAYAYEGALEYYNNVGSNFDNANSITVAAGSNRKINFSLNPAGSISGIVTNSFGYPLANISVGIADTSLGACTDANGYFRVWSVPVGFPAKVYAGGNDNWCGGSGFYIREYWQEVDDSNSATPIVVQAAAADVSNINFTLTLGGGISGIVRAAEDSSPLENVWICAFPYSASHFDETDAWNCTETKADGTYFIGPIDPVAQRVWIFPEDRLRPFYNNSVTFGGASSINLIQGLVHTGVDFSLPRAGIITGTVYDRDGVTPLEGVTITTNTGAYPECSQADGSYRIFVPEGTHTVMTGEGICNSNTDFTPQYYGQTVNLADAIPVTVSSMETVINNIDFVNADFIDLALTMSDTLSPVKPGDILTYTLTVTNQGLDAATDVILTNTLPSGITFASGTANQGTGCEAVDNIIACNLGSLSPVANVTVTIQVTIESGPAATLVNVANVIANEIEVNNNNNASSKNIVVDASPLSPSNLTASLALRSEISLSWQDNSHDETLFFIERSSDGNEWIQLARVDQNQTTYVDQNLHCSTVWMYRIRAYRGGDKATSGYSDVVSGSTACPPLMAPSSLLSQSLSRTQINLSWIDNSPGEVTQFHIERSTDGINWTQINILNGQYTAYSDAGLICGTTYSYRVRAYREEDNFYSGYSDIKGTTTDTCPDAVTNTVGLYKDGNWMFRNSNSSGVLDVHFLFGPREPGWTPLVGDWDGDGIDGIGVYKDGIWILRNSSEFGPIDLILNFSVIGNGWIPIVGDWDGDDIDTPALYKSGTLAIKNSNTSSSSDARYVYGPQESGWLPIAGDWNGSGADTVSYYRDGQWIIYNGFTNSSYANRFNYGPQSDEWLPIAGDWDQNLSDTIGLYKAGNWRLRNTNNTGAVDLGFSFGTQQTGWQPIANYRGAISGLSVMGLAPTNPLLQDPVEIPTETVEPTATDLPEATPDPTIKPIDTVEPEITPEVTVEPTLLPETAEPTITVEPEATLEVIVPANTPEPTVTAIIKPPLEPIEISVTPAPEVTEE